IIKDLHVPRGEQLPQQEETSPLILALREKAAITISNGSEAAWELYKCEVRHEYMCLYLCGDVCVCMRERERQRACEVRHEYMCLYLCGDVCVSWRQSFICFLPRYHPCFIFTITTIWGLK